jgi:hypothetical protein
MREAIGRFKIVERLGERATGCGARRAAAGLGVPAL